MNSVPYERALESVGYGRFQRRLLVLCGLGWAADAMEVLLVSFALPAMSQEWGLSAPQKGLLGTAIFLGMLVGAVFWGRLSDIVGRKTGFILTIAFDSIFGLASAFAPNFGVFVVLRILTGFGVGGTLPVDYGIFSEYLPAKNRGRRLVLLESFWALGTLAAAALSWVVVPRLGWRVLFAISAAPGILLFLVRRYVPESPRFLLSRGRVDEARQVLQKVAEVNGTTLPEGVLSFGADGVSGLSRQDERDRQVRRAPQATRVRDLFSPDLLPTTALLWVLWFAISLGYYGCFTWIPSWFRSKGIPLPSVYPNAFLMSLFQLPGYFSAAYLVERWGRRATLGVYLLGSGAATWLFYLAASPGTILAASSLLSFFALGAWGALYAYTPEVYPTSIRTTGIGAASGMTRIAGAIAPSVGAMVAGGSLAFPLTVFALSYGAAGLAAFLLPRETRGRELL